MVEWGVVSGRLVPYWIAVASSLWILAFLYAWTCDPGFNAYYYGMFEPMVSGLDKAVVDWSSILIGLAAPIVFASCACSLLLTAHTLPAWRCSWLNKTAVGLRRHPPATEDTADAPATRRLRASFSFFVSSIRLPFRSLASEAEYGRDLASKRFNQFGRGEPDFNAVAIWLAFLPMTIGVLAYLSSSIEYADEAAALEGTGPTMRRVQAISSLFAWGSIMCLVFFLIPVTKHSVLLAAMGWSPIHALRIHIWFGYLSFVFMLVHGCLLVPLWFLYFDYPVYQQIVPDPRCWTWTWTAETEKDVQPDCFHAFANSTGIVAALSFIVLWGSSLNWVRRRNYRLFYILHMTFGTLTLLSTILHVHWSVIYFLPSITYYLAATAPTLVQALASRFRGGVTIRRVVPVEDGGGCVEVHLDAHETANAALIRDPCQFVKVCVPAISLVWHPFDVFKSCNANGTTDDTVRFLFRPVGPFTRELAMCLTSNGKRPTMLVDGFYRGSDKAELALQHDCVTMVAGGVGLSPYLTLIPALLLRLAAAEGAGTEATTKALVLHWSCREPGLCAHYVDNYLNPIVERASSLNLDATLTLYVYLTGGEGKSNEVSASSADLSEAATTLEGSSSRMSIAAAPSAADLVEKPSHDTEVADPDSGNSFDNDPIPNDDGGRSSEDADVVDAAATAGHAFELARVLPRRHSSWTANLPFFTYYSGVTFFGFWLLFSQDPPEEATSYYDLSKMAGVTVGAVLAYFAFGILMEASVLGLRRHWPAAPSRPGRRDVREVAVAAEPDASAPGGGDIIDGSEEEGVEVEDGQSPAIPFKESSSAKGKATLVHRSGRPSVDQIFEEARTAAAPGIFTCGPLARTVREEASRENSLLGLTRYCLYDEPYEM